MKTPDTPRSTRSPRRWIIPVIQALFLLLFVGLHFAGLMRVWLFVLIIGLVLSPLSRRFFCRAACPVNAVNCLAHLSRRGGQRRLAANTPGWLRAPWFRAAWYALLVAVFAGALIMGQRFYLFTIITAVGVILCRVLPASAWCNGLCPWGALMRLEDLLFRRKAAERAAP